MDHLTTAMAEIRFFPPAMSGRQPRGHCIPIDKHIYQEYLVPLPRDRDLLFHGMPLIPEAAQRAEEMKRAREAIIDGIARELAKKLLEFIEAEDPQHGYSPEEWEKIKPGLDCGGAI